MAKDAPLLALVDDDADVRVALMRDCARAGDPLGATETRMERKHEKYERLLDFCKTLPPTPTAVAHPCDESSLRGAVDAAKLRLITPILVGPRARIETVARDNKIDITGLSIVDAAYSQDSATTAPAK